MYFDIRDLTFPHQSQRAKSLNLQSTSLPTVRSYCWWKIHLLSMKPYENTISSISTGAGFLPSTETGWNGAKVWLFVSSRKSRCHQVCMTVQCFKSGYAHIYLYMYMYVQSIYYRLYNIHQYFYTTWYLWKKHDLSISIFFQFSLWQMQNRASLPAGVSPQRVFSCTRLSLGPQGSRLEVTFFWGGHHETSKVPGCLKLYLFHYYLDVCCGIFVVLRYDLI